MRAIQTFGSVMYRASREESAVSIETRTHAPRMETIFCEVIQEKAMLAPTLAQLISLVSLGGAGATQCFVLLLRLPLPCALCAVR